MILYILPAKTITIVSHSPASEESKTLIGKEGGGVRITKKLS